MPNQLRPTVSSPVPDVTHLAFRCQVTRTPDAVAVVRGDEALTYSGLAGQAECLAHWLIERGVRAEERIGIVAGRTPEMVVATLAVLQAGGCYVPIDPALPAQRKRFMIEDAGVRILLFDADHERAAYQGVHVETIASIRDASGATSRALNELPEVTPSSLAYIMYTSGSTGRPKGAMIEHRSIINLALAPEFVPLAPRDRLLMIGAIGFDATTFELWASLLNGLTFYLPTSDAELTNAVQFARALVGQQITTLLTTTSLCIRLLKQEPTVLRSLTHVDWGRRPHSQRGRHPVAPLPGGRGHQRVWTDGEHHVLDRLHADRPASGQHPHRLAPAQHPCSCPGCCLMPTREWRDRRARGLRPEPRSWISQLARAHS